MKPWSEIYISVSFAKFSSFFIFTGTYLNQNDDLFNELVVNQSIFLAVSTFCFYYCLYTSLSKCYSALFLLNILHILLKCIIMWIIIWYLFDRNYLQCIYIIKGIYFIVLVTFWHFLWFLFVVPMLPLRLQLDQNMSIRGEDKLWDAKTLDMPHYQSYV